MIYFFSALKRQHNTILLLGFKCLSAYLQKKPLSGPSPSAIVSSQEVAKFNQGIPQRLTLESGEYLSLSNNKRDLRLLNAALFKLLFMSARFKPDHFCIA